MLAKMMNLNEEEARKFFILALTFLFLIGVYWLLRSVKDSVLASTVGLKWQPTAKIASLFFLVPLILLYSSLVDTLRKNHLFYYIGGFYGCLFLVIGYLLDRPGVGLSNTVEDPYRIIGWATYLGIESFGSLMVALFWSLVANATSPESAKKGYPFIVFGAQFGSITGPLLAANAAIFGVPALMIFGSIGIFCMLGLMYYYSNTVPNHLTGFDQEETPDGEAPKRTGILEGLRLLFSHKYIAGIFCIATFYEFVGTILDYQMKVLARQTFTDPNSFAGFMGTFGVGCNVSTLLFSLMGTSYIMKRFGLTFCIVLFPVCVGCVVFVVYVYASMWVFFGGVIVIKCFTYALNNPAKEIMYIPTSKDIKFKTKSWIDMFGSRSMKALGSSVNNAFVGSPEALLKYGTMASLCIVVLWIFVASFVGKKFESLTANNETIG